MSWMRRCMAAVAVAPVLFASGAAHASGVITRPNCPRLAGDAPNKKYCMSSRVTHTVADDGTITPFVASAATPSGFGATDLQSAYNLPASTTGAGMTVAIVDAYRYPGVESDMATYRQQYGLPACTSASGCFTEVNSNGQTSPLPGEDPQDNSQQGGWGGETMLDVEMVSAICPSCKILLVEATDAGQGLYDGANAAASLGANTRSPTATAGASR